MMNARATPIPWAVFARAVAKVLCFGGNQTELRRGGAIITGRPTMPTMMCPMWNRKVHLVPSGTKQRMPVPIASSQEAESTDIRRPKRSRNHMNGNARGMNAIGP